MSYCKDANFSDLVLGKLHVKVTVKPGVLFKQIGHLPRDLHTSARHSHSTPLTSLFTLLSVGLDAEPWNLDTFSAHNVFKQCFQTWLYLARINNADALADPTCAHFFQECNQPPPPTHTQGLFRSYITFLPYLIFFSLSPFIPPAAYPWWG